MIINNIQGVWTDPPDPSDIADALLVPLDDTKVLLQNDSWYYSAKLLGPSNSGLGMVWSIYAGHALENAEILQEGHNPIGPWYLTRNPKPVGGGFFWVLLVLTGYAYHIRPGIFLRSPKSVDEGIEENLTPPL